jgi:hypothetical protein
MASSPAEAASQQVRYFAEPAFTVDYGRSVDEQGVPCTVMEARISLQALRGADATWPRISFFAQRMADRPAETKAVTWPPRGQGYEGGDLALLRTDFAITWVEVEPKSGAVPPGVAFALSVRCCVAHHARARMVVTTNDPCRPALSLPLEVRPASEKHGHLTVHPNPFVEKATVLLFLQQPCPFAEVTVHDLLGRRVRALVRGCLEPGSHSLLWDGRDDSGVPVPSGLYFVRAKLSGVVTWAKVVRVR